MLTPHSEVSASGHLRLGKNPMALECYAKVEYRSDNRLSDDILMWFCKLRIIEAEDIGDRPLLLRVFKIIPKFRWEVVEKCVNVSWHDKTGGAFDWEDIPEVLSYLSQDETQDNDGYTKVLHYSHYIRRDRLVSCDEMRELLPECFIEGIEMPVEILADYMRDRI